jgi:hypothetical protein
VRRRLVLALVAVVLIVVVVLGVHSCDVSSRNAALRNYTNNVSQLINASDGTGGTLFSDLSSAGGGANAQGAYQKVVQLHATAERQLGQAERLSAPSQVSDAQAKLVLAMRMRADGMSEIANNIQQALGTAPTQAVDQIATGMFRFLASDVLYKAYVAPEIAAALHSAGIAVGAPNGLTLASGQFLRSLSWLTPSYIAAELGVSLAHGASGKIAPGTHGHRLNSVSVGGTQLSPTTTNTLAASPAPTFTLNITNDGQNTETGVVCEVSLSNGGPSGRYVIPETTPGETTTCPVTLSSSPAPGNYTLTAKVKPVPGETDIANNSATYPVNFH